MTVARSRRIGRRHPWAVTSLLFCMGLAMVGGSVTAAPSTAVGHYRAAALADPRPNILLILTDDQTRDDLAVMDRVRNQIGGQGTTFTRGFAQQPLCCPARASILTGQYAHNNAVMSLHGFGDFQDRFAENNLAVWLQDAGYNTAHLGKYLNGYPGGRGLRFVPPGWTDWQVPVRNVYSYRNYTMNENGRVATNNGYQTTYVQEHGISLVEKYAPSDKPFFMWLNFLAPHWGGPTEPDDPTVDNTRGLKTPNVGDVFRDAMSGTPLPDKPSFLEKDMSDKPALPGTNRKPVEMYRELFQQRREALLAVDVAVGRILTALEMSGEANRTIVIFSSDNGYLVGEHRKIGKIVGYEESVGVPMLVRGPGFAADVRRDQLVSLTDLTSTITRAAGVTPGLQQDGEPMQPRSNDAAAGADRSIPLEAGPRPSNRLYTGIRTPDDRVLLRWRGGATEFYNLLEDPFQLDGRISEGETAAERNALARRLDELEDCAGAGCS